MIEAIQCLSHPRIETVRHLEDCLYHRLLRICYRRGLKRKVTCTSRLQFHLSQTIYSSRNLKNLSKNNLMAGTSTRSCQFWGKEATVASTKSQERIRFKKNDPEHMRQTQPELAIVGAAFLVKAPLEPVVSQLCRHQAPWISLWERQTELGQWVE